MANGFTWEVYQADRRRSYQGAPLPVASLHVTYEDGHDEFIDVPASVGRRLAWLKQHEQASACSRRDLAELIDTCANTVAWEQLVRLFERRDYSEKECFQKLCQMGFERRVASSAVKRGVDCGLVSDARYADSYIRSKIASGWGMGRIERELASRGISTDVVPGWPFEFADPEDELARAREVAARKTVREPNRYAKLVRFLMGRGFSYGVSSDAARSVLSD